jgi:hypothetical protein
MRLLPRATRIATNIGPGCASAKISQFFNFRSKIPRPLGSTSVNVLKWACSNVGRPGLDPGTLGLKGTVIRLWCVSVVAHVA